VVGGSIFIPILTTWTEVAIFDGAIRHLYPFRIKRIPKERSTSADHDPEAARIEPGE
jgi:hypothetical protein